MHCRLIGTVGALALTLGVGGCRSKPAETPRDATIANEAARATDRAAEMQRQREQELSKMDDRIAAIERDYSDYQAKRAARPLGTSGTKATPDLRHDVKSDLDDVKQAVNNLRTTNAENWWERHESALKTAVNEVEADVKRFSASRTVPPPKKEFRVADPSGHPVSTEPFMSSRDKFVADMRSRIDAMDKALGNVKATGPRKTELDDLHARVNKLGEDIDRLKSATADDWWDLSKARVNDYIARLEKSVARLDKNDR